MAPYRDDDDVVEGAGDIDGDDGDVVENAGDIDDGGDIESHHADNGDRFHFNLWLRHWISMENKVKTMRL